jgi:nitroimidazol reductase NimA-like FMN-containing flavoprotein (pyridoxamine 5'-phosphate oxidase superfamily)
MTDLAERARKVLAANRYLVLGTVDPAGRPRVSPVWFSMVDHRDVYWLSSPEAHHSRNVAERPDVSMVVYDSTADPGSGAAVYLEATAERVAEDELEQACAEAFEGVDDALSFTPESLRAEPFVLYRARVSAIEVHVRGSDPEHGTGVDRRMPVEL